MAKKDAGAGCRPAPPHARRSRSLMGGASPQRRSRLCRSPASRTTMGPAPKTALSAGRPPSSRRDGERRAQPLRKSQTREGGPGRSRGLRAADGRLASRAGEEQNFILQPRLAPCYERRTMRFPTPVIRGTLIQRYKRFLADVRLDDGRTVTATCPNTGSMLGLASPGAVVWLSESDSPTRKYRFTWEMVEADLGRGPTLVGINTQHPNRLVAEAM